MSPNFNDLLQGVKQEINEVSPQEVSEKLAGPRDFTLLDVREKDEWDQGHIDGALFLPRGFLEVKVEKMLQDKQQPVIVYCAVACGTGRTTGFRWWYLRLFKKTEWPGTAVTSPFQR